MTKTSHLSFIYVVYEGKSRILSEEMNLWGEQHNTHGRITKPMKIFCHNLKLTQLYRQFKITEINGYNMFGEWTDRQTSTLNYEMSTTWETKPRTNLQKTSPVLMGSEQVTRPKSLQVIR